MNFEKPFVIGIAGSSCSGKSFIADRLKEILNETVAGVISLDSYYHDLKDLPFAEREQKNFDRPEAVNFDLLKRDLNRLLRGEIVRIPVYDFSTHTRKPETEWTEICTGEKKANRQVLILEGLYAFRDRELRELIDFRIFVETDYNLCLSRRIERDVRERGRSERSVRETFENNVLPMYERFVLPTRDHSDLVIDGADEYNLNLRKIMNELDSLF